MAFDAARTGRGPASRSGITSPRGGGGAFSSAFDAASSGGGSSQSAPTSYQGADRMYTSACETIERELRKLTQLVAATRKQVEAVGTPKDSADLRKKLDANIEKGKDIVKELGAVIKRDLTPAVEAPDLTAKEHSDRKMQQGRYMKDYKEVVQIYTEVAQSAVVACKRHATPSSAGAGAGAGARGGRGGREKDPAAAAEEDRLMQRLQQVDFDTALIDERDDAINDIATAITEVNDTFKDLAQIVEEQGRDIEQIEMNIGSAETATESGVGHLTKADTYQKRYGRWIIVLIFIIVAAAGGITAFFVLKKN